MSSAPASGPAEEAERRRRIRRSFVLLALVAAAFYIGFIVLTISRSVHG